MSTTIKENKPTVFYRNDVLFQNKYCNQDDLSILDCGGREKYKKSYSKVWEFNTSKSEACDFPCMIKPPSRFSLVNLNNDILAIGGDSNQ